jgi:glycosyltransferase involved in cell wall biosynthesis
VVCNSVAERDDTVAHSSLRRRKTVVIYDGVRLPSEVPQAEEQTKRILIVADLIPHKGHAVALTAFAQVRRALPRVAAKQPLAGSGSGEAALRAQANELGIDGDVDFVGPVADIAGLLGDCSFTVLPSLTEGMPNAVLESLAHGRPVVASAVGGVPEILSRGGGILVRPGEPDALAEAMRTLLCDPGLIAYLGVEGRAVARGSFGVDRMAADSLRLYYRLLGGRSPLRSRTGSRRRPDGSGQHRVAADATIKGEPGIRTRCSRGRRQPS